MIEVSSLEQTQGNISCPTLFLKVLLLLKSWKMNILSWPILCTSSSWLQPCSAPFPPSEATHLWWHLWCVKHTCTLHAKIFFCSCHYFVGLCKFLPFRAQLRLLSLKMSSLPYAVIKQKEIALFRSPYEGMRMLFTHMKGVTSIWTYMKMGSWCHYGTQKQPHISLLAPEEYHFLNMPTMGQSD